MAALFEVSSQSPALGEGERGDIHPDLAGMTAGLGYISRCLRGHRPFGILTGSSANLATFVAWVSGLLKEREDLHSVRIATPTDSVHIFLSSCLQELGYELGQAGLDDLHNLLLVFLRHEGARGRRTVALIEATEHYGPRVFDFMQTLSKVRAGTTPAITFLLTGSRDLHRVLDSPAMASLRVFTRERFDLDRSLAWVTPGNRPVIPFRAPAPAPVNRATAPVRADVEHARLVVMLDGAIVERRPLAPGKIVIGRSAQAGLRLNSRYVSRHHAVIVIAGGTVTVVDLRSTNGTLVNGQAVSSHELEHGDLVAIGNFRIRFDCRPGTPLTES